MENIVKFRILGASLLGLSTLLSIIIANLPQKHEAGLFGVAQIFAPILIGAIAIVIFILLSLFVKNKLFLWAVIVVASIYIIYVGLDLHYKF